MLIEKLIFNMLAFSLLVIMVVKMIRKNDNIYFFILGGQVIGIIVNFLELVNNSYISLPFRAIIYLISIIIPLAIVILESKKIYFPEYIYILLSRIAYKSKNYKICKNFLDNVIKINPESYYGHKMLAILYEKEGGLRKSIDEYVRLIELKPNDYESYYKIGVLLDELGKKEEAATILNNLLKKKPDFYKASELLGIILCEQEKFKQAETVYQSALKYNPLSYELYYNLAIVHTRLNDFASAKECYERAAEINHGLYNAYYSLGQIHLLYQDMEAAEEAFTKSLYGKETESKAYYQLAKLYLLKGDKEKGIIFIINAIKLDRNYIDNVKKEEVFNPIRQFILEELENTEGELEKEESDDIEEDSHVNPEQKIEDHLANTLDLVQNLNELKKEETPKVQSEKEEFLKLYLDNKTNNKQRE